jgi:hypothetical protein
MFIALVSSNSSLSFLHFYLRTVVQKVAQLGEAKIRYSRLLDARGHATMVKGKFAGRRSCQDQEADGSEEWLVGSDQSCLGAKLLMGNI